MPFLDLINSPQGLSLYAPFVSGLGIDPNTPGMPSISVPSGGTNPSYTDDPLSSDFLTLLSRDPGFFAKVNENRADKSSWVQGFTFSLNNQFGPVQSLVATHNALMSGFNTGNIPPNRSGVPLGQQRYITQFFTLKGTITSAFVFKLSAAEWIFTPSITALTATIGELSSTSITALSGTFDWLSATNLTVDSITTNKLTAVDASILNLTGFNISAHDITTDLLTTFDLSAHSITTDLLTTFDLSAHSIITDVLTADNVTVNFDLTADEVYVKDIFITGQCFGCPGGKGSGDGLELGALTAEYIEIINPHTDIPALRVTQYGDQPLAIFYDITGHPELNFASIATGGEEIPGTPGQAFSLGLNNLNVLYRWGSNAYGQLGGTTDPILVPEATAFKFTQVDTAGATVVALSADGTVWTWGYNVEGELGNKDPLYSNTSTPGLVLADCRFVAAGHTHTAAIKNNNDLWTWGNNLNGQLGVGVGGIVLPDSNEPVFVGSNFSKVALGGAHSIAIKTDGSLWGWGSNSVGQVGNGGTTTRTAPTLIDNTKIYTYISCGTNHSIAIDTNKNLYAWGSNGFHQLGTVSPADADRPQLIGTFKYAACGFFHTLAITPAGALFGWGKNTKTQLISPLSVSVNTPTVLDVTRQYTYCSAGKDVSFAIDTNGNTVSWGNNDNHQAGLIGTTIGTPTTLFTGETSGVHVAMIIDGSVEHPGFVGIQTDTPNKELTVRGDISASGTIFGNISAPTAIIDHLTGIDNVFVTSHLLTATADDLSITVANISTATITDGTVTTLHSTTGNITSLTANNLTSNNINTLTLSATTSITTSNLSATTATISSLSSHLIKTDDINVSNDLTVLGNISAVGEIRGKFTGSITTETALLTSLTAEDIFATSHLGVGTSSIDSITGANAQLFVSGNTVITDNLSVLGLTTLLDTRVIINSAVIISNPHTETCLTVNQSGGLPVAEFYYTHAPWEVNQIALFIDGYAFHGDVPVDLYRGGYVGVRTKTPNEALTVRGNISASGNIYTRTGTICASSIFAHYAEVDTISATTLSADVGDFKSLIIPSLNISGDLTVKNLTATNSTVISSLSVGNTVTADMFIGAVSSASAEFINLTAVNSFLTTISSNSINSVYLSAITADINILHNNSLTSSSISATEITVDSITLSSISASNIHTDFLFVVSGGDVNLSSVSAITIEAVHISAADIHLTGDLFANTADITLDLNVHRDINASRDIHSGRDLSVVGSGDIGGSLNVGIDLSAGRDVFVVNDITARRFLGEVIGPTVSIGNSADLITLSAQRAHINDLKSEKISATEIIVDTITALTANIGYIPSVNANTGLFNFLTAVNLFETNRALMTSLTAATADIGFLIELNTNVGFVSSLTSHDILTDYISANAINVSSLSAEELIVTRLSALTINISNTAVDTNLVVTQHGFENVAEFYYNEGCNFGDAVSPALVIKGFGCMPSVPPLPGELPYQGGFVGVRTATPNEALTVFGNISTNGNIFGTLKLGINTSTPEAAIHVKDGDIWATSISAKNTMTADVGRFNDLFTSTLIADDITTTNINAVDETISHNLSVGGTIFGNLSGSFSSSGESFFESLLTDRITAAYIQTDILSANDAVYTPGGNSNQWNAAYGVPVTINMVIDGGASPILPGTKSFIELPYNMQLLSWSLYADFPSTFFTAVSVLSSDFANFPNANPIHPTAPTLNPGEIKTRSTTLNMWDTNLTAGTVLFFGVCTQDLPGGTANIDSTLMTLSLKCVRV